MSFRTRDEDQGFEAFFAGLRDLAGKRVKVGIQGNDGSKSVGDGGLTMVGLAIIHEMGVPAANIPQRSFLRSTADQNKNKYEDLLARMAKRLVKKPRGFNAPRELLKAGERVRADIINRMRRGEITPELADSTKRNRGEEGPPLVDTGLLMGSVRAVVK